jgi:hypothetical protein
VQSLHYNPERRHAALLYLQYLHESAACRCKPLPARHPFVAPNRRHRRILAMSPLILVATDEPLPNPLIVALRH